MNPLIQSMMMGGGVPSLETSSVTGVRAALIDSNNSVVNIIVWADDEHHVAPEGLTAIPISDNVTVVNIGWTWDGTDFIDPNPPELHVSGEPTMADLQAQIAALTAALNQLK